MALTEQILAGEWFHIEEDQEFAPDAPVFRLADGRFSVDDVPQGTYEITGDAAVLTFDAGPGAPRSTLRLHAPASEVVTETTSSLMADSTTRFDDDDEPLVLPGLFRRRVADTLTTEQVAARLKDRT